MTSPFRLFASLCLAASCLTARGQDSDVPKTWLGRFWYEFNYLDTTYVEPNHYNWEAMIQNTNSMEWLNIKTELPSLSFSSEPSFQIGPYIGWRWIFLGYTFAVNKVGPHKMTRTETELSLYGSMLCCDIIYRSTGDSFKWSNNEYMETAGFPNGEYSGGVNLKTFGADVFYVFNHRQFSLPSLFAQSTVQKRSCGSWLLGASVTSHKFAFDTEKWPEGVDPIIGIRNKKRINYMNYAVSFGYGHNWVLSKGFMVGFAVMPALGYKHITSATNFTVVKDDITSDAGKWIGNNLNFDFTARLGLAWNNNKWFAGANLIFHNYNFAHDDLGLHNSFGTLNFYFGLNFMKRKAYRSKGK